MSSTIVQRAFRAVLAVGLACGLAACSQTADSAKSAATGAAKDAARQQVSAATAPAVTGVVVQPRNVQALAKAPATTARKRGKAKAAGKGRTAIGTANSASDDDVTWIEEIDLDGDGTVEQTMLLWDDEDKVLFLATQDGLLCKEGGGKHTPSEERGGVLIAVFGEGNPHRRPAGSGWWVTWLDQGQCQAQMAGIYGCDFDAKGNPIACGAATIDEKNDAVMIVAQLVR